jgi:hypothetical protein
MKENLRAAVIARYNANRVSTLANSCSDRT